MTPTPSTTLAPPGPGSAPPGGLTDAGLVDLAVSSLVTENACRAARLAAICEHHARAVALGGEPCPADPSFFLLTPLQATTAEFSPALAVTDLSIAHQLEVGKKLMAWFPSVWAMCESGRLDLGRAGILLDAVSDFAHEEDIPRFAALIEEFIAKYDDPDSPLCLIGWAQLQRAARYRKGKFAQKSEEACFAAAFKKRRLSFRPDEHGIGSLAVRHQITDAMAADYRVTLIARQIQQDNPDETRTLDQLRADVTLDLLLGRLEVSATNAALEAAAENEPVTGGRDLLRYHKVGAYARPIINVTVPIQTLLGLSEEPGMLSGGNMIPAELARIIANQPDSTWYRMLTDPARRCIELSTTAYQPSPPVWREVVARDQICLWPGCSRPAVRVETDHRIEHPEGPTSTENLGPLCKRHHKVKHSRGYTLTHNHDGTYTWTTPTGRRYTVAAPEQPVTDWPDPVTVAYDELSPSA